VILETKTMKDMWVVFDWMNVIMVRYSYNIVFFTLFLWKNDVVSTLRIYYCGKMMMLKKSVYIKTLIK
jgi:hypothetical protein